MFGICFSVTLAPGESRDMVFLLGAGSDADTVLALVNRYGNAPAAKSALDRAAQRWRERLGVISVSTPDPDFNVIINQWSLYQALSSRMWARSAVYQSSGAFGFRDQLQDVMAFTYAEPVLARTTAALDYDHYRDRQLLPIAQAIANVLGTDAEGWFGSEQLALSLG